MSRRVSARIGGAAPVSLCLKALTTKAAEVRARRTVDGGGRTGLAHALQVMDGRVNRIGQEALIRPSCRRELTGAVGQVNRIGQEALVRPFGRRELGCAILRGG